MSLCFIKRDQTCYAFCSVFRKHEATILGRFYSGKLCYTITTLFYHMHYFTISAAHAYTVVATNVNAMARDIHRLNVTFKHNNWRFVYDKYCELRMDRHDHLEGVDGR